MIIRIKAYWTGEKQGNILLISIKELPQTQPRIISKYAGSVLLILAIRFEEEVDRVFTI